ncbi:MAG: hypothetical protein RJA98_2491 [Pseudomonadota bacterium]|jgi:hypothetical protein
MIHPSQPSMHVTATVDEVLPQLGLAYLSDDARRSWAVTKSTQGSGLAALQPGQRVDLTIERHADFSVVSDYAPLD